MTTPRTFKPPRCQFSIIGFRGLLCDCFWCFERVEEDDRVTQGFSSRGPAGTKIDDDSTAALDHARQKMANHVGDALDVDINDPGKVRTTNRHNGAFRLITAALLISKSGGPCRLITASAH